MKESVQYFADAKVKRIGVSHCTGQAGMTELSQFSDAYYHNRTGSSLII
jgi:metal-dependent hydrolase (beta-lactamase superfamily II)